ncbi:glutamate 5-kinase [Pigmentibacter sp. JX0631]|uniref:glutamate 5-kinase n=1 Tax=Pigmentibacter sp. JX0631 TaxID=2976982 RepID=UPI0024682789|nr:glutamate 5-kinase [Pigmentibacter sp. JX0631]WGL60908.1 glutamate 5-kinase [Pigmentibacter sp. JX0631]
MKIVIKVGTQAILDKDGTVLEATMHNLVQQIAKLQQDGIQVILVSSGAVGSGRKVAKDILEKEYGSTTAEKQLLASLGQHELLHTYSVMFKKYAILAAQILLTKQEFNTRQHYLNISRLLKEITQQKNIVPIINENDSVAIEELMFTDNDELSGLIASQFNADKLIILTSVKGVYNGNPDDPSSQLISVIDPANKGWPEVSTTKSKHGRGGMITKLGIAKRMSDLGITTHICSIQEDQAILNVLSNKQVGTTILPTKKKSNLKRWIAFNTPVSSGVIYINDCLFKIIQDNQRILSILPVGIEKVTGEFKKGDLIEICNSLGKKIGVGIAKYHSEKLKEFIGQKGKPEIVHYDQLHFNVSQFYE